MFTVAGYFFNIVTIKNIVTITDIYPYFSMFFLMKQFDSYTDDNKDVDKSVGLLKTDS